MSWPTLCENRLDAPKVLRWQQQNRPDGQSPAKSLDALGPYPFLLVSSMRVRTAHRNSLDHLVGVQQELTWTTQRQITLTSTFQNAITRLILGFPPSSVSSCAVTRITTLGFFAPAFAHSHSIISAFSTSV